MGNCSSCLGRDRRPTYSDEDDESRLLYDDVNGHRYGTFGHQYDHDQDLTQGDSQEMQRETEALQKVVAQTSNHLVDIFAMAPQDVYRAPSVVYAGQDSRLQQYHDMLTERASAEESSALRQTLYDEGDWLSESEDDKMESFAVVKPGEVGPLLGGFADLERDDQ